jgi:hypothetical protein
VLIEFSLNFNNVKHVLGGPHGNELHLPGQILPLLIGLFGFVRICYLILETWRSPGGDVEPSLARAARTIHEARTMHAKYLPLAFSPAMMRHSTSPSHDPNEIDELGRGRGRTGRYLIAWLPWLSLLRYFQDEPVVGKEKRWSEYSGVPQEREKIEFSRPPRRVEGTEGEHVRHGETV